MTEAFSADDCEVLVVGAGPTGLMAASLLKRSGVAVRVVDSRREASRESRAFAIQARTMELFAALGLADRVLDRAVVNTGIDFHVGSRHVGGLDYDRSDSPDTPFPFITLLPQSETERILIEELERLGVTVERGVTMTSLDEDAEGVTARATTETGEVTIRSRYVVGADGAHSAVRKALNLGFEGEKYAQTFMLADCRVDWHLDHARFRVFMNGPAIGLFLPLDGARRSRVMVTDPSNKADLGTSNGGALDLGELEASFRSVTDLDVRLAEAEWKTRYRVSHRGVPHYGRGRAFVAGDAAHIHSPAGGQGMNTGLQDAANLAWKLAAVLRGAPADLLGTYDGERRPVGRQVVETSDRMFSATAGRTGWEAALRDRLAGPVSAAISHLGPVQRKAFRRLGQLEIDYGAASPFVEDAAPRLGAAAPRPGGRAPDAAIDRHLSVHDLLAGYRFSVLALSRRPLDEDEAARIAGRLDTLRSSGTAAHLVARSEVGRGPHGPLVTSPDAFDAYGLADRDAQAIYVVRPDGYVAWRGNGFDVDACGRFLARFGLGGSTHG